MSLINDALKKAQRERTGGAPETAPVPGGGSRPPVEAQSRANRGPQVTLLVAGAAVGMALAIGLVWIVRPSAPSPAAPQSSTAAAPTSEVKIAQPPAPAAAISSATHVESAAQPSAISVSSTETEVVPSPPQAARTAVGPVVSAVGIAPVSGSSADAPKAESPHGPKLSEIVDAFRIAGIRAAGADSKVLLNDRVYRVGDLVDAARGIRLTGATANSLTFMDSSGETYVRHF